MDIVTLVNRTSKPIEGTFDGVPYVIKAHGSRPLLANVAEMIKRQNPIMGTEDATDLGRNAEFLVGIQEWGDDCSPIEQSAAVERFDRSTVPDAAGQKATTLRLSGTKASRVKVAADLDNPVGIQTG